MTTPPKTIWIVTEKDLRTCRLWFKNKKESLKYLNNMSLYKHDFKLIKYTLATPSKKRKVKR